MGSRLGGSLRIRKILWQKGLTFNLKTNSCIQDAGVWMYQRSAVAAYMYLKCETHWWAIDMTFALFRSLCRDAELKLGEAEDKVCTCRGEKERERAAA